MRTSLIAAAVLVTTIAVAAQGQYAPAGEIHVGGQPRFDYLTIDSAAKRLYLAHATEIVVIDTAANKVVGTIPDLRGVHGVLIAPNGKGFITAGQENKVAIFDLKTLQISTRVDTGANPDAIAYDPKNKEVYAFNHTGKSVTVINADSGAVTATIPLSGTAESGAVDPQLGRVYVNIENTSAVDVIDTATHKVIANWKVAPAEEPTGMAIDVVKHRLFVGGGPNQVMLDGSTGKVIASAKICDGTDATAFDPGTSTSFSSCGDGHITIIKIAGDTMTVAQTLATKPGARTMAVDPATHKIYVAAQEMAPAAAGAKPAGVPDSFKVLVYAQGK